MLFKMKKNLNIKFKVNITQYIYPNNYLTIKFLTINDYYFHNNFISIFIIKSL